MMLQTTILLLDEPLSNLDADLRARMRGELKRFQYELGQTMVYVTHDQIEAMSLSDRIAVMDFGKLQQFDTPYAVYNHPVNVFVAQFIGSPQMNLLEGEIRTEGDRMVFENPSIRYDLTLFKKQMEERLRSNKLTLGIRPEHIEIFDVLDEKDNRGMVCEVEPMGADVVTVLECGKERVLALTTPGQAHRAGAERAFRFDPAMVHIFDRESGLRIGIDSDSKEEK